MKQFLIDENLPRAISFQGDFSFIHVVDFGRQMSDSEIWDYAIKNNFIIVTKDTDFYDRIILHGPPPKIIWIRFGNMRRKKLEEKIKELWGRIVQEIDEYDLLEIHDNRIEGLKLE